ncbi:MAG TPA: CHAT domain-containing protein, partial [Chloroflexota bacterium]|nr:CHAT domain-containing protein [Chloroflexota bacterium]
LGLGGEALLDVERARAVLVRHGEWLRAGGLDLNTAVVYLDLGQYHQALSLYDRAQRAYESLGEAGARRAAWVQANRAMTHAFLGDLRAALRLHEDARALFARHGEPVAVLRQDLNIALVYAGLGDYTRALRLLAESTAVAERAGLEAEAIVGALIMVECYLSLNRHSEALQLAEETIERCQRCGTATEVAKARVVCAEAHAQAGDAGRALSLLGEASATLSAVGLAREVGAVSLQRAALHVAAGDLAAAEVEAREAHDVFAERGLVVRQAQADLIRARVAVEQGDSDLAAGLATAALATTLERDVDWLAHEGHHVLARVAMARGDSVAALVAFQRAVESLEQVQSRQASQLRTNFLADKLAVYHDAIDLSLRLDRPALALEYLERAKSRALVDYLAATPEVRLRARHGADQALLDELSRLRQEHNWLYGRLYGHGLASREAEPISDRAEAESLEGAIREREKRIARILERLTLQAHDLEGIGSPPPTGSPAVLGLDEGTVLLEYYLREDGGAIFVQAQGRLEVVPLRLSVRDVQVLLHRWRLGLDATAAALGAGSSPEGPQRHARRTLEALHRALIQPVEAHLAGRERLVMIPYGATHAVPWHALFDGERHLLERLEVVTCPSSALLRLCATRRPSPGRAPESALVLAFSDGGRLPQALHEARTVASLFPGERYLEGAATEARVKEAAPRHGIVHLAAHGEARLDNPTFAHLQLADGQLSTAGVFNLALDG